MSFRIDDLSDWLSAARGVFSVAIEYIEVIIINSVSYHFLMLWEGDRLIVID